MPASTLYSVKVGPSLRFNGMAMLLPKSWG